jgi:hypothetical protein
LTTVCTVRDPTTAGVPSPTNELASFRHFGRLDLDGWIDFTAIRFGTLLHVAVAEIHI